ncbi:MAG: hypothetical protein ETSY2_39215 [Candidatus Entotheonella gemina]|uniref:Uncharacterized protein n=1 Tax=Candidatus Entotheonella gemina TaxID=1429439 RepID=W4LR76_9BACT|nr:MAG: hypothetical protein ETSY2_39215 [Candidatus Entotheonella gemina]
MATIAMTTVSEARAIANEWLMSHLPDRFASGVPECDQTRSEWRIPVWLSYPQLPPLGPVGELMVEALNGKVTSHTSIDDMKNRALKLYEHHCEQIEAPLL